MTTRGVVLFAVNNANTDYVAITKQTIRLITHTLKLPITIITSTDDAVGLDVDNVVRLDLSNHGSNVRYSNDTKTVVQWKNFGRYLAYEHSPYDETMLLDTDYLTLDNSLLKYFEQDWDYLIPQRNINLGQPEYTDVMGDFSLPYVWATIVAFRKTPKAKMLFDLVGRIQRNYGYYKQLYNIPTGNYRNDYAFAIANYILNGYQTTKQTQLPQPLTTLADKTSALEYKNTQVIVKYSDKAYVLPVQNLHILSKHYLLSDNFKQFVDKFTGTQ